MGGGGTLFITNKKSYNRIEISMYKFVYIYKYDMINNICLCTDIFE